MGDDSDIFACLVLTVKSTSILAIVCILLVLALALVNINPATPFRVCITWMTSTLSSSFAYFGSHVGHSAASLISTFSARLLKSNKVDSANVQQYGHSHANYCQWNQPYSYTCRQQYHKQWEIVAVQS
jgi:hypothetical protein